MKIQELFSKLSETIGNVVDCITLMNFRDVKSPDSQHVIQSSLKTVFKSVVINRLCGSAALLFAASLLLVILGAVGIHAFARFPIGLIFFFIGSLILLSFIFLKRLVFPLLTINREKIALLVEQEYPSLNNAVINSIQLTRETARGKPSNYSPEMISLLVKNTADKLRYLDLNDVVDKRFSRLSYAILIVSVFTFGMVCAFNRSFLHENLPLFLSYLSYEKGMSGRGGMAGGPLIGDITITYRYPLYSGLQSRTVYNTNGDIKALKGSEVQVTAMSDHILSSAGIILNDSTRIPFTLENGKTMKGALSALEGGTYLFETVDPQGRIFKDTTPHTIQLDTDQYPEIIINAPAKDMTVHEKDTVELNYTAKDDFSISEIALMFEQGNEKKVKSLMTLSKKQNQYSGTYGWSLSELGLQPDDKIAYHIEVKDNDTISGPKVSASKTYYLEVYSSKKKHLELIQLQEELLHEMLLMLSDDLTKRADDEKCTSKDYLVMTQEAIYGRVDGIIRLFTDILVGMQEDTMANYSIYYSLENLKNKFRDVTEKKRNAVRNFTVNIADNNVPFPVLKELQKVQDEEVVEVENIIIFLNELIQKQKLDDVLDTGKNLIQSQQNIEKLLEKLRQGEDSQLNEKALAELKRVEDTIQQMMEKLMKMAQSEHMDEFLNADALKNIEQNDIMKEMNAMKEAFEKGDMDAALQAAQKLLSALQSMMNQMKSSAEKFADSSYNNMLKDMDKLMNKISELENQERELTENTEKLKKDAQKRTADSTNEAFKSFFEKQGERVEGIKKDISGAKDILAKNELLQKYLQVNRDLKRISEQGGLPVDRFSELFGGEEEPDAAPVREDFEDITETARKNAELNREINKDPMQRDLLYMSRELPQAEETLSHLEEMVKGWDVKESMNLAKELLRNLNQWNNRMQRSLEQKRMAKKEDVSKKDREVPDKVDDATQLNQQIVKDLEAMMQFLESQQTAGMTQEEQEALQQYAKKQQELQEETDKTTDMADELSRQNPFMDRKANRELDMASKSMGGAKQKLEKGNAPGAVLDERESLYRLAEAKKGVGMAKDHIEQGMKGGGIPMPMPMPFRGKGMEGQFGASTEKVEIPSEEAYKVPKEFRQDILDALKQGLPEKYKDLNKDYYQRLVD